MAESTKHRKAVMIEAMIKALGNVTQASEMAEINPKTHYDWMKNDVQYNEDIKAIKGRALDFAESKLMKQVEAGNITAIIFYLKTQGKERGYIERVETSNVDNVPFVVKDESKGIMKVLKYVDDKHNRKQVG